MRYLMIWVCLVLIAGARKASAQTEKRFGQRSAAITAYIDNKDNLVITRNADGKELLHESFTDYDAAKYIADTTYGQPYTLWDINFDGYDDLSFASNSGNVQRFEEVYLYNPRTRRLERSAALSEIACLGIDKKTKLITGSCYHSSAAENWTETYQWQNGKLLLIGREGTMPCPPGQDCYYSYKQKRVKGKLVYVYKNKIKA